MSVIHFKQLSILSCSAFVLMLGLSNESSAQDYFNAVGSGDWDTAANWVGSTLPDGTNAQTIVGSATGTGTNNATATITGPLTNPGVGELRIGSSSFGGTTAGAVGTVDHSSGTLSPGGWSFIGVDGNTSGAANLGTYNLSGSGELNSGSVLALGVGGNMGLNNGVVNIRDNAVLNTNTGDGGLAIGWDLGNTGTLNQTGGTINANWATVAANSAGTTGTFNMSGGEYNGTGLTIGENDGASGVTNVSGTADLNLVDLMVGRNDGATGVLNINGSGFTVDASNNFYVGLNDGGVDTTATGTVSFTSDVGGLTAINAAVVSFGDAANLIVDTSLHPSSGDILLVDNTGAGAVIGTFTGLAEGALVPGSGGRTISYAYGDGNNVALVAAIPEPGSAMLLLVGLGVTLSRRKRASN